MSDLPASSPAGERDEDRQLREMNEALLVSAARQHELAAMAQKAEERSRESEERLAAELVATQRLQAVSIRMILEDDVDALYQEIMDAAVDIMGAQYASLQMLYPERGSGGELRLLAFRGFNPKASKVWEWVRADSNSTCGAALLTGDRVIVPDVETCDFMAGTEDLATYLQTGIHAVQTTPLVSRSSHLVGMISTHWHEPHQPSEHALRLFDLLVRQAADFIERKQVEKEREQLLSEMARRQTLFDSILSSVHDLVYVFDREGRFTYANRMLLELWDLRADQALGRTMAELNYPKDVEEQLLSDVRKVIATGQVVMSVTHYTNPAGLSGYYENILAPVPSADGRVELITGSSRDITERKQAEITQQLLLGELNHRVKNTLATIQAIAQQTLRRTSDPEQFVAGFNGRVQALARVHTLLTNDTWQGADLRELIRDQVLLNPIDETRLTASGPSIKLEPQMALHMAMMLHELGTNSFKYGALSVAEGGIAVSWTVQGQELSLRWIERGGPPVEMSASQGFGSLLIEQSAKTYGGTAKMLRETQGVSWIITLQLKTEVSLAARPAARRNFIK